MSELRRALEEFREVLHAIHPSLATRMTRKEWPFDSLRERLTERIDAAPEELVEWFAWDFAGPRDGSIALDWPFGDFEAFNFGDALGHGYRINPHARGTYVALMTSDDMTIRAKVSDNDEVELTAWRDDVTPIPIAGSILEFVRAWTQLRPHFPRRIPDGAEPANISVFPSDELVLRTGYGPGDFPRPIANMKNELARLAVALRRSIPDGEVGNPVHLSEDEASTGLVETLGMAPAELVEWFAWGSRNVPVMRNSFGDYLSLALPTTSFATLEGAMNHVWRVDSNTEWVTIVTSDARAIYAQLVPGSDVVPILTSAFGDPPWQLARSLAEYAGIWADAVNAWVDWEQSEGQPEEERKRLNDELGRCVGRTGYA